MDSETQEIRQARQRASVKWLLSKAFNNRVPDNLKDPFYYDHDNMERLKPQIIVEMGNATLYCQALSNMYSDPNYQSLNHWSILQTLARKGAPVIESQDMPLTETVLIQTNPLKINAHMSVIESLMVLYAKEMTSGDRIPNAIQRISNSKFQPQTGHSYEHLLLAWISHTCAALKNRIERDVESGVTDDNGVRLEIPDIPPVRDFQDLCDGISIALLVSFYCPRVVPWTSVRINYLPAVEDSIHNVLLVSNFSQKHLPYNVFHMTPEDITYMRGSMKLNLIVLLADLFNLFEIHPAKCVCYAGMDSQAAFVVHKSRGITTLSSLHSQHPQPNEQEALVPARLRQAKEKSNSETKSDERGDFTAAGRPSNWEQNRRPSYAGRRSRRNSSSEDSQLTIENFGGSQDQLNTTGRFERDRERKLSTASVEPAVAVRSSIADARGTLQLGYDTDSGSEKQDRETEKYLMRRQASMDNVSLPATSTGNTNTSSPILAAHREHSIDRDYVNDNFSDSRGNVYEYDATPTRKSSQPGIPDKSTTWQNNQQDLYEGDIRSFENATRLSSIRVKLEEKRRRIEQDKLKVELALLRHQEKDEREADILKWETLSNESKRTPDMEAADLEKYQQQPYGSQQHLADHYPHRPTQHQHTFGSTPHLPQTFKPPVSTYNSRPPSRDAYQQMQPIPVQYVNEQGQYLSPQQQSQPQYVHGHSMYGDNTLPYNPQTYGGDMQYGTPQQHYAQSQKPYMSRAAYDDYPRLHQNVRDISSPHPNHYMYDSQQPPTQRRTWAPAGYDQHQPIIDINAWQSQKKNPHTEGSFPWNVQQQPLGNASNQQGFVLHQNGGGGEYQHLFQVHSSPQHLQHQNVQRQQSMTNLHSDNRASTAIAKASSAPTPFPPSDDMMAPQSICFIGDEEDVDEIERNILESMQATGISDYTQVHQQSPKSVREEYDGNELASNKLNITSGNLTYRIPSPSRPSLNIKSFQDPSEPNPSEKGFYISFDNDQPKRPKPPLRAKRSPKKENSFDNVDHQTVVKRESLSQMHINSGSIGSGGNCNGSSDSNHQNNNSNIVNSGGNSKATYNKYTDAPIQQLRQLAASEENRRHLEDVTNQHITMQSHSPTQQLCSTVTRQHNSYNTEPKNKAIVIGNDDVNLNQESVEEMERRKEKIMLLSLQRRQQQEEAKARKEIEAAQRRERDREKEEERTRKKEEQMARRAAILEQHRLKKAIEEAEREGKTLDRAELNVKQQAQNTATPRLRQQRLTRPRPKTIHVDDASVDISEASSISSRGKKGSSMNIAGYGQLSSGSIKRDYYRGSQDSLTVKESPDEYPSTSSTPVGRRGSYKTSREPTIERGRNLSRISVAKGSTLNFRGRKSNSLMNLCDSGLGRATPPRRAPSPGMVVTGRHMPSPSGPGSLPPGLISKRRGFDDGSSDISSNPISMMEYSGPRLYKQPAAKSNRGIILNAVEYCVFPGAVNREAKQKVLEKIARSEAKHFLVLFRDAGCQFRALYSYLPDSDQVSKLYGTGPSQVDEVMFDKFFKYNSGGKCFSQVHTKHLTVTIDAFTIHNSLWQGKKVQLQSKKDMALVI